MRNNYDNIPEELKRLNQWIVWKLEDIGAKKPTKIPYNAITGRMASVNDPGTWTSFDRVVQVVSSNSGYSGIGFVFTDEDDYSFVDLDYTNGDQAALDRQIKIFQELDSYSEISPGGNGLHVIVKGKILAGRRRSYIEIYSSQRYATFTGNIYPSDKPKPIAERQNELTQLWEQMGEGTTAAILYNGENEEKLTDAEVIEQALNATNGDKFNLLHTGKWESLYQSQSEADLSYIDIIAFYSKNRKQIHRIFKASLLGQRIKSNRIDYIERMINKSFDKMLPQLDFDGFKNAVETKIAKTKSNKEEWDLPSPPISIPPGLTGEIAKFIFNASPRPVPQIALAAAIGLMSGICGRAYNISNTGLNQYILLLAKTGMGKEGMAAGIDKLMSAIKQQVPTANDFIGPSHIASGQALVKYIHRKSQCFVSILGEFGYRVQAMSSQNASTHERMLKQILLEIYNKSGHTDVFRASIHADLEKNTEITNSPAFSLLGESTPHTFYEALTEEMIIDGLLPRFLTIEYIGRRAELNENHSRVFPSITLIQQFASLVANCATLMHSKRVMTVKLNEEATEIARRFDRFATDKINQTDNEVTLNLWNRAHLKSLKLAGIIAIGCNMVDPVVTAEHLNWAITMVQTDIANITTKFEKGEIGISTYENKQLTEIIRIMREFVTLDWQEVSKYTDVKNRYFWEQKIVPYNYISRRLIAIAAFRRDKNGPTLAIKRAIQVLTERDTIRELGKPDLIKRFQTTQRAFIISNLNILG